MDVGAGTGVLSMFAAKAGARKVYAVEASEMARHIPAIAAANGVENVVEVLHSRVEDVKLKEKVDIIVSEWMGFYLFHECMLPSVLFARDRFLKEGGILLPGRGKLVAATVEANELVQSKITYFEDVYGLDFSPLQMPAIEELTRSPQIEVLNSDNLISSPTVVGEYDFYTITAEELRHIKAEPVFVTKRPGQLHAVALWFDVTFSPFRTEEEEVDGGSEVVVLDTSPMSAPTHWKQTVVFLPVQAELEPGMALPLQFSMVLVNAEDRKYTLSIEFPEG
uniref:Protein arginine N-methyltransferase domain-containing protein n=1 Tax=Palpitomonas bilix TaxID=652834 RepID=A0A7S3LVW1_9EUKA